ncbi:MAG: hypothetical protein AUK44_00125 [Porphyromonadaceae bacterium CG2_30_38_12]|nr:MAG: hypothetical protein AUK44_00125 [Porphyromonadaceae bacterium CG2_30_38_12]
METLKNTILVIEDDLGLNELICEKITERGYQTHSALSATEAIQWLSGNIPTLMIVDYNLNGVTANEFILDLQEKGLVLPPFIISTGQGNEHIAVDMMKLGARDYIIKDTNLLDLLPKIIGRIMKEIENEHKLKLAQEEIKENTKSLKKILIESSVLINISIDNDNYQKITDTIADISEAKYVSFDLNNKSKKVIQTYAFSGLKENIMKITSLLGFDIIHKQWNYNEENEKKIKNQVVTKFDSINEITSSQIPNSISKLIEKKFNLGEVYIVKIEQKKETIGFFSLFFTKGSTIKNINLIELYVNQVGLYLVRKNAEEKLLKKMNELKFLNDIMIDREIRMVELKKEINEVLISAGQEKRYPEY